MAGPGNILIKIGADAGQAVRELSTVDKAVGSTMTTSEKMGATVKKAALPAAAALGAIGYAAIGATKAAMEDAAASEHLAGVMKRTTGATDAQVKATEDWISGLSRSTGVADDELRPAMETLITATGDVSKAQKDMKRALDISAASGKSVEEVSKAIALAHTGQTAKLEKLVPGLSKAAKESDNMAVIMGELADKTGGAMAASTETAAGQMKIMQNQTAELQESLGAALLPAVEAVVPMLVALADVAADNEDAIKVLIVVVAAVAAAILAANAAVKVYKAAMLIWEGITKAAAAAQWLFNAALSANPIGLVIVALAALGVALVIAYQKSETFRNIVQGAMKAVENAIDDVKAAFNQARDAAFKAWDWVTDHWKLALFAFGPIGIAVGLIATHFESIKTWAVAAWNYVTEAWVIAKFAFGPIQSAVSAIASAFKAIWRWSKAAWDAVDRLIDILGKIKVPKIKLPGGIDLPGPFLAPAAAAGVAASRSGGAAGRGGAASPVTVNVYGAVDPEGTARAIRRILDKHDRRQGRSI